VSPLDGFPRGGPYRRTFTDTYNNPVNILCHLGEVVLRAGGGCLLTRSRFTVDLAANPSPFSDGEGSIQRR